MRSAGFILDSSGNTKRTWVFQVPHEGYEQAALPVEDGDEVIILDLEHPDIPMEPRLHECRNKIEIQRTYPVDAITHRHCRIPSDGHARRVSPRLRIVKQLKPGDDTQYTDADTTEELIEDHSIKSEAGEA